VVAKVEPDSSPPSAPRLGEAAKAATRSSIIIIITNAIVVFVLVVYVFVLLLVVVVVVFVFVVVACACVWFVCRDPALPAARPVVMRLP
jgi:hypothetical protein